MIKSSVLASMCVLALSSTAHAGGQSGSIGVGAEYQLSGVGGLSAIYDAGKFHVGGFLGYDRLNPNNNPQTLFEIGGEFFFHVHTTATADFGVGGTLGIANVPSRGMGAPSTTDVYLEPGFQIRLFLAANVALSFMGGIILGLDDAHEVAITGAAGGGVGLGAGVGVHYYFF